MSDVNTVPAANQQSVAVTVVLKVRKIQNDSQKQMLDLLQQEFAMSVARRPRFERCRSLIR